MGGTGFVVLLCTGQGANQLYSVPGSAGAAQGQV